MAAVMVNSMRMLKPAVFVLDHKTELPIEEQKIRDKACQQSQPNWK